MFRFSIKPSSGSHSCLLKLLIARYYFSKYVGSMSYFIVMSWDCMLLVFLVLTSCFRACRAWRYCVICKCICWLNKSEVKQYALYNNKNYLMLFTESIERTPVSSFLYFVYIKAIPERAWSLPDSSLKLRLPDFQTVGTCG